MRGLRQLIILLAAVLFGVALPTTATTTEPVPAPTVPVQPAYDYDAPVTHFADTAQLTAAPSTAPPAVANSAYDDTTPGAFRAVFEFTVAPGSQTVFHTVTNPRAGQGVLNGIETKFLNPDSRFGRAFYISDDAGTTLAELAHHGAEGSHTIRFSLNSSAARILDLTDSAVAKAWGYSGGEITNATKAIGSRAIEAGFNVIKYPSMRGPGTNFSVLGDFQKVLTPQMIVPVP